MSGSAGRERELRERDTRARRRAQSDFERPLVLEAGAGTGKTTALVARVVAWCLGPGWEGAREPGASPDRIASQVLSGVVAITFTEAAAAEMGRRVGEALHEIESGAVPLGIFEDLLPASAETRTERARALRGALDHLVAQTIHAYCRRLLVTHPLDAGLHPSLEVDADQRLQREIVRELLEERLRVAYAGDSDLLALAARGVGPQELEVELLSLLEAGVPSAAFRENPVAPARVAALGARLGQKLGAVRRAAGGLLHGLTRTPTAVETIECVDRCAERLAEHPLRDRAELLAWVAWLEEQVGDREISRLSSWGKGRYGAGEAGALGEAADRLTPAAAELAALLGHLRGLDLELLDLARRAFGELLEGVETEMRRRGVASFSALLDGACELLTSNPGVASRVRSRIDQLLVDEFQDTDRRQCDIVRAIALQGPVAERPGLFVVGDPKQSIYGWRSADLSAYEGFVADVVAAGGDVERLSVNHRSVPAILAEVERAVAPVMLERAGLQPAFQPLVASERRADAAGHADARSAPVEYWISAAWQDGPVRTSSPAASRIEAAALARDLRRLHDVEGVPWSHFGVLFRSRTDWDLYLGALREHAIPFAVEGDRSYYRRREIVDAAGWVRCVLDPNDAVALVTLLRSAPVGVPDAALIPLWCRELPFLASRIDAPGSAPLRAAQRAAHEAAAALPRGVPGLERVAGWEHNLCEALEALGELRASARSDPADVFVEKLRLALLIEATESARYQGAWRVANLDRFFRELLEDLDEGGDSHRALRRLRSSVAEELDAEEGRPREILDDAVQIMTIHGAKGLDFEHVYLMQCHKGRAPARPASVGYGQIDGRFEYQVLGSAETLDWDRVLEAQRTVEEAERVRTFYVALTRARSRLVVAGLWPALQFRAVGGSMAELLGRRVGGAPDPESAMREAAAAAAPLVDVAGARFVFPGLEDGAPAGSGPETAEPVALPSEREIAEGSARLRAARQVARGRMARALTGAASREAHEDPEPELERRFGERLRHVPRGDGDAGDGEGVEARAVGTAVHRALEHFDFGADADAELARAVRELGASLAASLPAERVVSARARGEELLARFARGPLLERLRTLDDHIVARELPVLVAPDGDAGPIAAVSGAIDLVYRDPESAELVIADYKTGRPRDHAAQGAHYRRALRAALRLDYEPRFELWYLDEGRIEVS